MVALKLILIVYLTAWSIQFLGDALGSTPAFKRKMEKKYGIRE